MSATAILQVPLANVLRHSAIPALRKLMVEETDSTVIISGSVSSYYLKQLAQETLKPALGSRGLQNHVTVVRSSSYADNRY